MLRLSQRRHLLRADQALKGIDLEVEPGEIVCLLGGNASGKSTTMKTILGLVRPTSGTVEFEGAAHRRSSDRRRSSGRGICAGARSAPHLRPHDGLGEPDDGRLRRAAASRTAEIDGDMERVYGLFPRLRERAAQYAGTLSGGEQQMLAMGRALMARPQLLLMDEPSMGLSPGLRRPGLRHHPGRSTGRARRSSSSSRMPAVALSIAHRGYVLQNGRIVARRQRGGAACRRRHPPRLSGRGLSRWRTLISILPQQLVFGLALGTVYGLIALGYTMVYGVLLHDQLRPRRGVHDRRLHRAGACSRVLIDWAGRRAASVLGPAGAARSRPCCCAAGSA